MSRVVKSTSTLTTVSSARHAVHRRFGPGVQHCPPERLIDIYFGPTVPDGEANNWHRTVPGKGWWTLLRLYNPLQSFFDKPWRPSEIQPI
jgi:hypothetical protein